MNFPKFLVLCFLILTPFSVCAADETDEQEEVSLEDEDVDDDTLIAAVDNLGPQGAGFQSEGDFGPDDEDRVDPKILRDFIENRGLIQARRCDGRLTIAADVRARWQVIGETVNGRNARGIKAGVADNLFKNEVALMLDYVAPKSWVSTKLRWNNFAGKDGGTATKVEMDRAFLGYDIYCEGNTDFYIELGRSRLDYLFDSRIEFTSVFDGIHLYYETCFPWTKFIIHGGPFIVDSFTDHYAWVGEAEFLKIRDTNFSFKYSLINWHRRAPTLNYGNLPNSGTITLRQNPRYRYIVSQFLLGYEYPTGFFGCQPLFLYAAYLKNHDAKASRTTNGKKANDAFYIGFTLGKLCKCGDWSLEAIYQYVEPLAVPEYDLAGIGHGNAANVLLTDAIIQDFPAPLGAGFTNYKGWQVAFYYALTDSLSFKMKAERTVPVYKSIGGRFRYKSFEMAAIYAF